MSAASLRIRAFEHKAATDGARHDAGFHAQWETEIDRWWALADELTQREGAPDNAPWMAELAPAGVFADLRPGTFPVI
jgi:hypothetical protein